MSGPASGPEAEAPGAPSPMGPETDLRAPLRPDLPGRAVTSARVRRPVRDHQGRPGRRRNASRLGTQAIPGALPGIHARRRGLGYTASISIMPSSVRLTADDAPTTRRRQFRAWSVRIPGEVRAHDAAGEDHRLEREGRVVPEGAAPRGRLLRATDVVEGRTGMPGQGGDVLVHEPPHLPPPDPWRRERQHREPPAGRGPAAEGRLAE